MTFPVLRLRVGQLRLPDAYPEVLRAADFVLSRKGGHGAMRELCEIVLKQLSKKDQANGS